VCGWDGWGEVSSCFGDCWCARGQGHNWKLGEISFLCFHFLAKRIRQSHDFCLFLESGLCRGFPFLPVQRNGGIMNLL